jgi:hypothetical protein
MWFQDKRDEGVLFAADFCPFPIPALALMLTVIRDILLHDCELINLVLD